MEDWGWGLAQVAMALSALFLAVYVGRRIAARRDGRLRAGGTVRFACRARWDDGEARRGKLVAPGMGSPLTFVPRRGKPWEVPTRGHVTGVREERTTWRESPYIPMVSVFYRTTAEQTVSFRLPATDAPVLESALAAARPGQDSIDVRWTEPPPVPVRVLRWWLLALAGVLLLGIGCGLAAFADWRNHDVTVHVVLTDGREHCVVSWLDPWTSEPRKGDMACPDDGWVGGPLKPGDRAEAYVAGWPFRGEVYLGLEDGDTVFSAGMWTLVLGLPVTAFGLCAAVVATVRRQVRAWRGGGRVRAGRGSTAPR